VSGVEFLSPSDGESKGPYGSRVKTSAAGFETRDDLRAGYLRCFRAGAPLRAIPRDTLST